MNEMVKEFKDIEISKIHPNEWNPNEQTDNVFNQLVEEIRTDGFDHPLQVVPCSCEKIDGPHYKIIGGEHRFKAVQVLGWEKVPCVIYENWNEELQKLKTVRRNLLSGELNDRKFTDLVRSMKDDNPELTNELLVRAMGFDNEQEYAKHLLEVTEREESEGREWLNDMMKATGNEVEAVDGLSDILNNIFTQYGETVPQSFMFFAYKGKTHLAVFMNEELKKKVEGIVEILKKSGQNMNDYLAENIVVKPSNE